jgi:hypothetical protein
VFGCRFAIVSESGASAYSASPEAAQEFPELEAQQRGTVSIARRLQDPLSEIIKVPILMTTLMRMTPVALMTTCHVIPCRSP